MEIRKNGLAAWLREHVEKAIDALSTFKKRLPMLLEAIRGVADDPGELRWWHEHEDLPLTDRLLEKNIVTKITGLPGPITELPREPWIGRRYAFQLPTYYYALKAIASKGGLEISIEDTIAEAKKL